MPCNLNHFLLLQNFTFRTHTKWNLMICTSNTDKILTCELCYLISKVSLIDLGLNFINVYSWLKSYLWLKGFCKTCWCDNIFCVFSYWIIRILLFQGILHISVIFKPINLNQILSHIKKNFLFWNLAYEVHHYREKNIKYMYN